jgi:hypothetical protein
VLDENQETGWCKRQVGVDDVIARADDCSMRVWHIWGLLLMVRSCLYVKLDPVHSCTETFSIFQDILRAKSDAGALMQFDR